MNKASIKIHPEQAKNNAPLQKEVGQLALDIYHTAKEIVILAPIAGVDIKDIHLSITDDVLVIKGTRPMKEEIAEESYYTRECFWGPFSRAIVLPLEAETKGLSATFENNVLEIRIPKVEREQTKVIKIKAVE